MKRETAIRYTKEIHTRLKAVNGIVPTPGYDYDSIEIKKVWVFGSTIKGSQNPNDLDLMIYMGEGRGPRRSCEKDGVPPDRYFERMGLYFPRDSYLGALKWLTKGMKKVSRHVTMFEGLRVSDKVEIYPVYKLKE